MYSFIGFLGCCLFEYPGDRLNFLPQRHRIIKRRQNERPRRSSGVELLHPRHRADLQRQDTSRNLLADRDSGNLDWNRWIVRLGVPHHLGFHCVSLRQAASGWLIEDLSHHLTPGPVLKLPVSLLRYSPIVRLIPRSVSTLSARFKTSLARGPPISPK